MKLFFDISTSSVLFAMASLGMGAACDTDDAAQVVLVIDPDTRTTELVEELRVVVYDDENNEVLDETNPLSASRRIPLAPRGGDPDRKYRVVIEGIAATGDVVVRAEQQGRYVAGERIERNVTLREQCHFVDCGPGMACTEFGVCKEACETGSCVLDPKSGAVFIDATRGVDSETDCTSPSTPCKSIAAAEAYVEQGARRVLVAPGMPYIATSIGSAWSGTESDPTILQSWGDQATDRAELLSDATSDAIILADVEHFQLVGFSVGAGRGASIMLAGSSSDVLISNVEIANRAFSNSNAITAAIHVQQSTSRVVLRGNKVQENTNPMGNIGILTSGGDVNIIGNVITGNDDLGININSLASGRIAYNRFENLGSDGIGAYVATNADTTVIEHNRMCNNLGRGIGINGATGPLIVRNNTIARSRANAIELYPLSTETLRADRNIFYRNDFFAVAIQAGAVMGNDNVFFENGSGPGAFTRPSPDTSIEGTDPGFQSADGCELRLPLQPALTTDAGEAIGAR